MDSSTPRNYVQGKKTIFVFFQNQKTEMFWTWKTFRLQPFPFILEFYVFVREKSIWKNSKWSIFLAWIQLPQAMIFAKKNDVYPGSPVDQTIRGWSLENVHVKDSLLVLLMVPSRLVDLDFLGNVNPGLINPYSDY